MESRTRPIPTSTSIARPATRRREVEFDGLTWIDLPQPVNADVAYLRERLRLDPLALEDVLSTIQRPKLDVHDAQEYLFLIAQVPVFDRDQRVVVSEVDMFAGRDFVVTIHDGNIKPLRRLFKAAAGDETARKQLMGRGSGMLLYRVLDSLIKQAFPVAYRLDEDLDQLKERLFTQEPRKLAQTQALLEQDVIALRQILRPNLAVVNELADLNLPFLNIDANRFYGDTADGMDKLYDLAERQRELVASVGTTVATLSVQQQGTAQRTIAVAVLSLAPLVLLAGIAALSLAAPPQELPLVFAGALLATLAVIAGLLWYGHTKRWF